MNRSTDNSLNIKITRWIFSSVHSAIRDITRTLPNNLLTFEVENYTDSLPLCLSSKFTLRRCISCATLITCYVTGCIRAPQEPVSSKLTFTQKNYCYREIDCNFKCHIAGVCFLVIAIILNNEYFLMTWNIFIVYYEPCIYDTMSTKAYESCPQKKK